MRTRSEFESLPAGEFPHVIAAAPYLATPDEPDQVFEEGLDLLRVGIEARKRRLAEAAHR